MNADEVTVEHEERNHVAVILKLFAESIRQPGEPALPSASSGSR
jgi:hypothetical protein